MNDCKDGSLLFIIDLGNATGWCLLGFGFGSGVMYCVGTNGGGRALITFNFFIIC